MPDQPSKNDPILITGGTGFIGSHLTQRLVSEGYQVILLDAKPNLARISEIADKVTVVEGDVGVWSDVVRALKKYKIRHVFHTAARLSVEAERQIGSAYSCNIAGTFNVLEASRIMQVQRLVFLSSLAVFGAQTQFPFHETSYRDPGSFYGVSKAFGEMLGSYYYTRHGFDFRGVRFAVVIGPGRRGAGATVTYSSFIENVALGKTGVIDIPKSSILPITYIEDAADFLVALWKAPKLTKRVYITGGVPIPIQDLIAEVENVIPGAKVKFKPDPHAERVAQTWSFLTTLLVQQGQENLYRDIEEVGWSLRYNSVSEIVKHFIEYVQARKEIFSVF
ncbi:MAG: NAD-dependent epimerase/dehydratase family protein [Candidatus Odinarchaeota archaeon]